MFAPQSRFFHAFQQKAAVSRLPPEPSTVVMKPETPMNRSLLSLTGLLVVLPLAAGCASRTAPFNEMDQAQITVLRLQGQEPTPQPVAQPAAAGGIQLSFFSHSRVPRKNRPRNGGAAQKTEGRARAIAGYAVKPRGELCAGRSELVDFRPRGRLVAVPRQLRTYPPGLRTPWRSVPPSASRLPLCG